MMRSIAAAEHWADLDHLPLALKWQLQERLELRAEPQQRREGGACLCGGRGDIACMAATGFIYSVYIYIYILGAYVGWWDFLLCVIIVY